MSRTRVSYIEKDKSELENAKNLVDNWYQSSKHLPEGEMLEKLAYMLAALFRDRTITKEHMAQLSVTMITRTDIECRMHGHEDHLLSALASCLGQKPFGDLIMKALVVNSLSRMKLSGL